MRGKCKSPNGHRVWIAHTVAEYHLQVEGPTPRLAPKLGGEIKLSPSSATRSRVRACCASTSTCWMRVETAQFVSLSWMQRKLEGERLPEPLVRSSGSRSAWKMPRAPKATRCCNTKAWAAANILGHRPYLEEARPAGVPSWRRPEREPPQPAIPGGQSGQIARSESRTVAAPARHLPASTSWARLA